MARERTKANGGGLDHWTIGLSIVNARLLVKALDNESGFVAIDGFVSFPFETKNPFVANDVGIGGGMLSSRGIRGRLDIIGACGCNECLWERIPNESL